MTTYQYLIAAALHLLTSIPVFHGIIRTKKELSIEQLYSYHSENEVEEEINDQNVEHVL